MLICQNSDWGNTILLFAAITARTVSSPDFNMDSKGFKQYLIVGTYLKIRSSFELFILVVTSPKHS